MLEEQQKEGIKTYIENELEKEEFYNTMKVAEINKEIAHFQHMKKIHEEYAKSRIEGEKILEEKKLKGLKKEFVVQIPFSDLDDLKQKKLIEISQKVKIAGFRPGKVPISHVEKLYGNETIVEVIEEKVSESSRKVLEEKDLRPAANPEIKLADEMEDSINKQNDITFSMSFEALPEIDFIDFKKIKLDKPVASPKKEDIDEALEYLAQQNKDYKSSKKGYKSKEGDKVIIDYSGSVDGEKFDGGTAEKAELVLGSKTFIDTFEDQLVGEETEVTKIVKVKFPEEYPNKQLEGKNAEFDVKIIDILNPVDSKVDDELAKKFGQDTLKDLKNVLEEQIKKDFDQAAKMKLKDSLFSELEKNHKFDLPEILVNQEFDQMWRQLESQLEQQKKTLDDLELKEKELKHMFLNGPDVKQREQMVNNVLVNVEKVIVIVEHMTKTDPMVLYVKKL